MADCVLCGGTAPDTDIINLTCSDCFEIFGYSPNGNPGDMSEKIVAVADSAGVIASETSYWIGPTASVANGALIPLFVVSPTRSNSFVGGVIQRNSDTQIEVVNSGLHNFSMAFTSSKSDLLEVEINGDIWAEASTNRFSCSINFNFTAGDIVEIRRSGGGSAVITDVTLSVARLS